MEKHGGNKLGSMERCCVYDRCLQKRNVNIKCKNPGIHER